MQFGTGNYQPSGEYFSAMDQRAYTSDAPQGMQSNGPTGHDPSTQSTGVYNDSELSVKDIGMSVPMGISAQNVQGIYSKIRMGVGSIEIGFPGVVRGQRNAMTPEMFGHDMRQAIRELGAINEVKFTTHAAYGIMGLSGFTGDNPYNVWFQREQRKVGIDEVKRAIDFAKDTAGGGSVVVHTGEVDRPISEAFWNKDEYGKIRFKQFEEEAEVARFRVVDERSGQVMQQVRKNQRISRPTWLRADHDHERINSKTGQKEIIHGPRYDPHGKIISKGDYIDYEGNLIPFDNIYDTEMGRVPVFNKESGKFDNEFYSWNDVVKETEERNRWKAKKLGIRVQDLTEEQRYLPEEVYIRSTLEVQEGHSRGWGMQYAQRIGDELEMLEKMRKAKKYWDSLEKDMPVEEKWKIMKRDPLWGGLLGDIVPSGSKSPSEILEKQLRDIEKNILFNRQASDSQLLQAMDSRETQNHLVSADKYAIREAVKSYAELGIHAMDQTINKKNPIALTVENLFPERFGGHPQELRILIRKSRDEMVNRLSKQYIDDPAGSKYSYDEAKQLGNIAYEGEIRKVSNPYYRGVSEHEARKAAETHIKVTFDTAHMNLWRKYWQNDPNTSLDNNDKNFKKWYLKEFEELAREGMIGNMHLVDNMGYQDEHLAPGQGNAPVKEVVSILKKYGYKGAYTVEPGADASTDNSDFHGVMKTWRHFGSPIYGTGMGVGAPQAFGDVQYSYFGQTIPPHYVFGSYSPSNEWTLWSSAPME